MFDKPTRKIQEIFKRVLNRCDICDKMNRMAVFWQVLFYDSGGSHSLYSMLSDRLEKKSFGGMLQISLNVR